MAIFSSLKPEHWIASTAALAALLTLIKGLTEYRRAQRWKKAEFLAQEIKAFRQDNDVRRVLLILDWQDIELQTAEHESMQKRVIKCTEKLLLNALSHRKGSFDEDTTIIRLLFDQYLDKLGLFERYVQSGLITVDDLKPYLSYWIAAMCHGEQGSQPKEVIDQLWRFIDEFDYKSVRRLCEKFGHAMGPS